MQPLRGSGQECCAPTRLHLQLLVIRKRLGKISRSRGGIYGREFDIIDGSVFRAVGLPFDAELVSCFQGDVVNAIAGGRISVGVFEGKC